MSSPIHQPQHREPSPEERELYEAFPEARAEAPPPGGDQAELVPDLDRLEREIAGEQVRASEASLQPAFEIHPARLPGRSDAPPGPARRPGCVSLPRKWIGWSARSRSSSAASAANSIRSCCLHRRSRCARSAA